ncbi:hypothetical protein ILUMI_26607 [Ignelater luminosus]|uniref:Testis-expressed sequence 9 protein n=1 Tax=Ignelater luminosus TaxID=2038154 RepID=A0A8K0C7P0_IGNLU|nr:hypothetical protein ILUMI_26607 [Ignelater luminosus]
MEEFDNVMKKQDSLLKEFIQNDSKFDYLKITERRSDTHLESKLKETKNVSLFLASKNKSYDLETKENHQTLQEYEKINLECVPDSVDQMGVKGMTHFYRAKIKTMLNEHNQLQQELKNKSEEIKKLQKESLRLVEEKDKWFQAYTNNKTAISKLENQVTTLNSKLQAKENENASLKKELEQLKRDLKNVNLHVSGHEVRLNRALEENEKMKAALKTAKQEEKELKEAQRKEVAEITSIVKRLEKQKTDLLSGFSKQLQLIDNLKKQKAYLEAAKLTQLSEAEFSRILDWNLDK